MPGEVERETHRGPDDHTCTSTAGADNGSSTAADNGLQEPDQGNLSIFAERFALFTDQFGQTCEAEHVQVALAVVLDPLTPDRPVVFYRGRAYDVALMTKRVLEVLRDEVLHTIT